MTVHLSGGYETSTWWQGVRVDVRNRLHGRGNADWTVTLRPVNPLDKNDDLSPGEGCAEMRPAAKQLLMIFPVDYVPADPHRTAVLVAAFVEGFVQEEGGTGVTRLGG